MKIMIIALLTAGILSCSTDLPDQDDFELFEKVMANWNLQELNSYRFTARTSTSSTGPGVFYTITVLPGMPPIVEGLVQQDVIPESPFHPFSGLTISEIYQSITEYIAGRVGENIEIQYNEEFYFIEHLLIYPSKKNAVGGWLRFEITDFEILRNNTA